MDDSSPTEPSFERKEDSTSTTTCQNKSLFEEWSSQKSNILDMYNRIHRGHSLLATSLAFGMLAYRDYHRPLDDVIQKALLQQSSKYRNQDAATKIPPPTVFTMQNIEAASDDLRRAIGSITAVRALRVATMATASAFAFTGAISLYATGCRTFSEFFTITRQWAMVQRQTLDTWLGVDQSVHRDLHPDIAAIQGMSEEQELDYVYKTYFPQDEIMMDDDSSAAGDQQHPKNGGPVNAD
jgi:hypothetical protein